MTEIATDKDGHSWIGGIIELLHYFLSLLATVIHKLLQTRLLPCAQVQLIDRDLTFRVNQYITDRVARNSNGDTDDVDKARMNEPNK